MSFALDVNILVYASDDRSEHHARAQELLRSCAAEGEVFYLTWSTVMGYLRIVTHPAIFDRPLSPEEAMSNIENLLRLPHLRMLSEEDGFWGHYRATNSGVPARGNQVHDAHLATVLRQHGVRTLVSHDRDFRRYDFLDVKDPL